MSLLTHIPAHSLSQLWSSLARTASPLGLSHIPALDTLLDHPSCQRGDVIEIKGAAASGKSHLLLYMLINCVLPSELGGWGKVGILLDSDHKFNVMRFAQLLRARVKRLLPANHPDGDAITTKAFSLLHVFRPSSSHQLAATIHHLPVYLATELPEEDLGILAVDSISAFYWPDRYAHEQLRLDGSRSANPLSHAFASITSFMQSHGPLVLLSRWDLNPLSASQRRQQLETPFPLPLTDAGQHTQHQLPVTCRINLYRSGIEHPLEVGNGGITANPSTISSLSAIVRAPGHSVAKQFTLQITEDDILVS